MTLNDSGALALIEEKKRLRREVLFRRNAFTSDKERAQKAAQALAKQALKTFPQLLRVKNIAGYWPILSELDPRPLMAMLAENGAQLALPIIAPHRLLFRKWCEGDPLTDGGHSTQVPLKDKPIIKPDILLVPLVAFDQRGNRLGYGKGYYDAAIAHLSAHRPLITIGLAFDIQEIDEVPTETHDQPLDAIVTPMQSININLY